MYTDNGAAWKLRPLLCKMLSVANASPEWCQYEELGIWVK